MNVVQETLGFRRAGLSPALSLLMSAFALLIPPATLTRHLRRLTERSPTTQAFLSSHLKSASLNRAILRGLARFARKAQGCCESASSGRSNKPTIEATGLYSDIDQYREQRKWTERNACIRIFGAQFEPRYIFRAGRLDQ